MLIMHKKFGVATVMHKTLMTGVTMCHGIHNNIMIMTLFFIIILLVNTNSSFDCRVSLRFPGLPLPPALLLFSLITIFVVVYDCMAVTLPGGGALESDRWTPHWATHHRKPCNAVLRHLQS